MHDLWTRTYMGPPVCNVFCVMYQKLWLSFLAFSHLWTFIYSYLLITRFLLASPTEIFSWIEKVLPKEKTLPLLAYLGRLYSVFVRNDSLVITVFWAETGVLFSVTNYRDQLHLSRNSQHPFLVQTAAVGRETHLEEGWYSGGTGSNSLFPHSRSDPKNISKQLFAL